MVKQGSKPNQKENRLTENNQYLNQAWFDVAAILLKLGLNTQRGPCLCFARVFVVFVCPNSPRHFPGYFSVAVVGNSLT